MRERDTGGGYVASRGRRAHDHEKNACKYVKPFAPANETNVKKKKRKTRRNGAKKSREDVRAWCVNACVRARE